VSELVKWQSGQIRKGAFAGAIQTPHVFPFFKSIEYNIRRWALLNFFSDQSGCFLAGGVASVKLRFKG
jgi:hypothetical protein